MFANKSKKTCIYNLHSHLIVLWNYLVSTSLPWRSFHCLPHILRIMCLSAGGTTFIISKLCLHFFLFDGSDSVTIFSPQIAFLNFFWNCVSSRKWNPCQIDLIQEGDEDQFEICSAKESRFEDGCLTLMQTQPPSFTQRFLLWEKVQTNFGETPKKSGK